jgi:crotonobetainyl-CoA:carnitine CoA-transferase CaiB-like acyl-CoA transferase
MTAKALALQGTRILDVTELLPGPYATQVLCDMGAEVIKIERPGAGDSYRTMRASAFAAINRGKKSVTLNLKSDAGRDALLRLANDADVLIEGYRPGVMARLGLGYDALRAVNSRIIYASVSGFGQNGPMRDFPGHDLTYNAVAGVLSLCGRSDRPEYAVGIPVADLSGGLYAVTSILAALMLRERTGEGQYLDIALADTTLSLVGPRLGSTKRSILCRAGNNVYETKDGRCIAVAALEDQFWRRLVEVLGVAELADARYAKMRGRWKATETLDPLICAALRTRTHDEWLSIFAEHDVPATSVSEIDNLAEHPQIAARGMMLEGDDGPYLNYPVPMQGVDAAANRAPCALGADTGEVLAAAGYTSAEIDGMKERGVC